MRIEIPLDVDVIFDLYCGAGGVSEGYRQAGFHYIIGVDNKPQPHYPFQFIQADALVFMKALLKHGIPDNVVAFHGSPPCQYWSNMTNCVPGIAETYPKLIAPTRELFKETGRPYVIENVVNAPLIDPVILCGTSFGIRVRRHRLFETNFYVRPLECKHKDVVILNPHNQAGRNRIYAEFGRQDPERLWRKEMGVEWMNHHEGREAIPPVYAKYVGKHLMAELGMDNEQTADSGYLLLFRWLNARISMRRFSGDWDRY